MLENSICYHPDSSPVDSCSSADPRISIDVEAHGLRDLVGETGGVHAGLAASRHVQNLDLVRAAAGVAASRQNQLVLGCKKPGVN